MSNAVTPPVPARATWWQRPVVAIAAVVAVTGLTGGVAYAATRGDTAGSGQQEARFPGGGQFPGGQGPGGQGPGGGQGPAQQDRTTTGGPGQTSRDSAPTT
ncbi:hypothetical protein [Kineococcus sp. SYSU DK002]|uniref:hypothetical protein n=1 Tax=Kineococcus sp. SYSU DK002 TaxID=3383123 RepID=UPI003D7E1208